MLDVNALSDPTQIDGDALARLTTVDTQANVGAVAAQRKKETSEKLATGPQPEIKIDPIAGTITTKNVPLKSFQQQTQDAETAPWLKLAQGLQQRLAGRIGDQPDGGGAPAAPSPAPQTSAPSTPAPSAMDRISSTDLGSARAGASLRSALSSYSQTQANSLDRYQRVRASLPQPDDPAIATMAADGNGGGNYGPGQLALLREIGVDPTYGGHGGIPQWRAAEKQAAYLTGDPKRLAAAVAAHRQAGLAKLDQEIAPVYKELESGAMQEAREQREARSQEGQSVRETMNAIHGMDLTGFKDPGEAVDTMSKLFPDAAKREGFGEAVTAAHHAQSVALQRKNLELQLQQAKSDNDTKKTNAILEHMSMLDQSINQQMGIRSQQHQVLGQDDIKTIVDAQDRGVDKSQLPPLNGYQSLQVMRYREANHQDLIPSLRPQAADALSKNDAIRTTTAELKSTLEPLKDTPYWNMPFSQLPNRIKYQVGMASDDQIGKLQSKFQIEKWAGTMALVRGMRNGEVLREVGQHMPQFGKDSLEQMYDKLSNADDYYQANENAIKKFGAKSGIITNPANVQAPAPGGADKPDPMNIRKFLRH